MFKLFGIGKRKMMRGKSKSPEAKFKEKQAGVNSFLLDAWLKKLKKDPVLTDRMSELRYGGEDGMRYGGEGESEGYEGGDLLNVLRQAREAKDLLKDEMGEGKGSWIHDIAEIMTALPALFAKLPQLQQMVAQQQAQAQQTQVVKYLPATPAQIEAARLAIDQPQAQAQVTTQPQTALSMQNLMMVLELEPEDAWQALDDADQAGQDWREYLKRTSLEEIEKGLETVASGLTDPEQAEEMRTFLKTKHTWMRELVEIAHRTEQKQD